MEFLEPRKPTNSVEKCMESACNATPPMDVDSLLELCMGNLTAVNAVLVEFERQIQSNCDQLEKSLALHDSKGTAEIAHALKGAAGMLHAQVICQIAEDLERMGTNNDLAEAVPRVAALRQEVRRCLDYLPRAKNLVTEKGNG